MTSNDLHCTRMQNEVQIWVPHAQKPQKQYITWLYWVKIVWPPFKAMASNDLKWSPVHQNAKWSPDLSSACPKTPETIYHMTILSKHCVTSIFGGRRSNWIWRPKNLFISLLWSYYDEILPFLIFFNGLMHEKWRFLVFLGWRPKWRSLASNLDKTEV